MVVAAVLKIHMCCAFAKPRPLSGHIKLECLLGDGPFNLAGRLPPAGRSRTLVKLAHHRARAKGVDPKQVAVVTDVGASSKFAKHMVGCLPCITATRGASRKYHISLTSSNVTLQLIERAQGVPEGFFRPADAGVSESQYGTGHDDSSPQGTWCAF